MLAGIIIFMVRLERIVIQGFKSFKRKVSIPFPTGFSVITGPNGSGKSNISDCISFVFGKTSPKNLRAKKARDLIFHGSKSKGGSDFAKVMLVFSNKGKILPLEEEEVSISRRINKAGISTYRLNGRVVTRQELLDVFAQARIHPDGHNIIRQGDVTRIIEMNPLERRIVLDEISGISEYDEKKEKAMKELEKIGEKVREAEIILEQKNEIMEKLKRERDSALEYKKLESELALIKSALIWKDYSESQTGIESTEKEIADKEKLEKQIEEEVKKLDKEMQQNESELESSIKDIFDSSGQVEASKRVTKLESMIENKNYAIDSGSREVKRLEDLIEHLQAMDKKINPAVKAVLQFNGVHGTLQNLLMIPDKYRISVDVAGGPHLQDVVVDTTDNAVRCVKYLKENKIGRVRFLPMDRIKSRKKFELPVGTIGWLSELVHHDIQYTSIVNFIFGTTACVNDIERARDIIKKGNRIRMVTLDGDLFEASGAIVGGYYKKGVSPEIGKYLEEKKRLETEVKTLRLEIAELENELKLLSVKEKKTKSVNLESKRLRLKDNLEKIREKRRGVYEKGLILQQELNKLRIQKARYESRFENLKSQWDEYKRLWEDGGKEREFFENQKPSALKQRERDILTFLASLGPVNLKSIEEFESLKTEFESFKERVEKIIEEKNSIESSINKIEEKKKEIFMKTMSEIGRHFKSIYAELTNGEAELSLEDQSNIESGLMVSASPPGKKLLYIDSMSSGEKTLTALAFLFAVQKYKPSPFYILDEADASLDRPNTKRIVDLVKKQSKYAQFIFISHNNELIKEAHQVYGISMEGGESKIIGIKLPENN